MLLKYYQVSVVEGSNLLDIFLYIWSSQSLSDRYKCTFRKL